MIFGLFSVLPAVLRLVVGAESVKLRQAVRRSVIYVCIIFGILCHMLIFFNLSLIFSHILLNTLKCSHFLVFPHFSFIIQSAFFLPFLLLGLLLLLLLLYLYQNKAVITISSGYYCILSLYFIYLYQAIEIPLYNYILNHCTITYNTIVPLYRVQSYDCITIYLQIVSTDCITLSFI